MSRKFSDFKALRNQLAAKRPDHRKRINRLLSTRVRRHIDEGSQMARNRMIKPGFWTSEQLAECSRDARLIFVGLWTFCDDGGVHPASAKRVKMEVLPGDDVTVAQIQEWIDELIEQDLLRLFSHNGADFWYVTGWKHQKIERPTYSYPGPHNTECFVDAMANGRRSLDDHSTITQPEVKGSEVKGSEGKDLSTNGSNGSEPGPPAEPTNDRFNEFWAAYPRKEGKKKAQTAWRHLSQTKREAAITDCATRYQATEKQFIPLPTTYLHGERWNDEPIPPKTGGEKLSDMERAENAFRKAGFNFHDH